VNLTQRIVLLGDGRTMPITMMVDCEGDETIDAAEAVGVVAGQEGEWYALPLEEYDLPANAA